jgi:hypothetical protein
LRRVFFSASLAIEKLSNPEQTLTNLFAAKKPVSVMPKSRNPLGLSRFFGLGLRSLLYALNTEAGIEPREAAVGGGWGGWEVSGAG